MTDLAFTHGDDQLTVHRWQAPAEPCIEFTHSHRKYGQRYPSAISALNLAELRQLHALIGEYIEERS